MTKLKRRSRNKPLSTIPIKTKKIPKGLRKSFRTLQMLMKCYPTPKRSLSMTSTARKELNRMTQAKTPMLGEAISGSILMIYSEISSAEEEVTQELAVVKTSSSTSEEAVNTLAISSSRKSRTYSKFQML